MFISSIQQLSNSHCNPYLYCVLKSLAIYTIENEKNKDISSLHKDYTCLYCMVIYGVGIQFHIKTILDSHEVDEDDKIKPIICIKKNHIAQYEIKKTFSPSGGLEPPTFRLTVERASQLRHEGSVLDTSILLHVRLNCKFLCTVKMTRRINMV